MRVTDLMMIVLLAGGLLGAAQSFAAETAGSATDTPEARSRCLGMAHEVDFMLSQIGDEQKALDAAAGASPSPDQVKEKEKLEKDFEFLAFVWGDLADYFEDSDPPSQAVELELARMTGDKLTKELDVCDALMNEMDKPEAEKTP